MADCLEVRGELLAEETNEEVPASGSTEERRQQAVEAMTIADHFLGLLNVQRAADKLEEQLADMCEDACPLKHSDTHVDVLTRYSGVLWWDGDLEGAADALLAADEILAERPAQEPQVRLRRADIWGQLAQVQRARGRLDAADRHLSAAVNSLAELVDAGEAGGAVRCVDALREAQAALGQVCVQQENYERAEQLYLAAFAEDIAVEGPDAGGGTNDGAGTRTEG